MIMLLFLTQIASQESYRVLETDWCIMFSFNKQLQQAGVKNWTACTIFRLSVAFELIRNNFQKKLNIISRVI